MIGVKHENINIQNSEDGQEKGELNQEQITDEDDLYKIQFQIRSPLLKQNLEQFDSFD